MASYAETFVSRQQYDLLLIEAAGFMRNVYPMLRKEWSLSGVKVIATKKQHVQHISKLNWFLSVV